MKIWINPIGLKHAKELLINKNVDYVVVGMKNKLSARNTCLLSFAQIKAINCPKLAVSLNNLYTDDQIPLLEKTLKQLKDINVRNIIFSDFAIKQICDEIHYQPHFVYNSETLTTNYNQLPFYLENNIKEVVLPRELHWNEIHEFSQYKHNMKLQVQAEGFGLMMHSKWNLLTNFKNQFKLNIDVQNKLFYLKEETRQLPNILIEDETGSHMFTGYNVSIFDYLDKMVEAKIDSIYFLSYLHNKEWVDTTLSIYVQALEAIKNGTFAKKKPILAKKLDSINKVSACGFLDPTSGLLHLEREVDNE